MLSSFLEEISTENFAGPGIKVFYFLILGKSAFDRPQVEMCTLKTWP